jgi:hypothetical protein
MPLPLNRFPPIWAYVSVRFIFSIMIAMALAFGPFAMPMGEASAAPMGGHHEGMAKAGHCDDQQAPAKSDGHSDKHKEKPCCTAGCMAAAMLPAMGEPVAALPNSTERPGLDRFYRGFLGEIATPPPRLS